MLFNSLTFLLFFPIVCVLYYAIPSARVKGRNLLLLVASYFFYMNWEPVYAILLLTSTFVTYFAALGMGHYKDKRKRKIYLVSSIVLNLAILFQFKYYNFLASNLEEALQVCGLRIQIPEFHMLLPVGISFYIFQALGYSIDVYRQTAKVEHDFLTYALFVSFFPQLVAGPIERSRNLLPQFRQCHRFKYDEVMAGVRLMLWGYFLKLVLADRCGLYVDAVFNNIEMHNGGSYLLASLLFPFQIYGRFRWLFTYCHRCGTSLGVPSDGEFPSPLLRLFHRRVLASVAHLTLHMVQGLCVYSFRWQPFWQSKPIL